MSSPASDADSSVTPPVSISITSDESVAADGGDASASSDVFTFTASTEPCLPCLNEREAKEYMKKWDLSQYWLSFKYHFGKRFTLEALGTFLVDFFNDPSVRSSLKVFPSKREACLVAGRVKNVAFEKLSATVLNMDFFDKFQTEGLVAESGYIRKCYDTPIDGVTVSDLLRDSILNPESDAAELYKPEGKKEFLYDLFKLITTGGSMCQHEDNWEAYLSTVKTMYKQLLSVVKNESGKMSIASVVVKVTNWEADTPLFPGDSPHNSCYVVVDPLKRTVSVVYSAFVPFW